MRDLQRIASFFIERGELYLELPVDSGTMRFRQAPSRIGTLDFVTVKQGRMFCATRR